MNHYWHTGDLGDCIASLPTVRALGGGTYNIGPPIGPYQGRESLQGARFECLRPLLEAQPYIRRVQWKDAPPKTITHDFSTFRHDRAPHDTENLAQWQARHFGVTISEAPWLTVTRAPVSLGRVVVARSLRYHNELFQWKNVLARHPDALFVGLPEEHLALEQWTQERVEYVPTRDLLELAEVIAGAELFVGNQSCPFWIAAGLGVRMVQETFHHSPNSRVHRRNAFYTLREDETASVRALFRK